MTSKPRVLIIDDEPDILASFADVFEDFKHIDLFCTISASEGIEIAQREKPNVILADLKMRGLNGEEALKKLKKLLPETKLMVMTGWGDIETRQRIEREIGVEAYYTKPVDLEKVVTKITSVIMVKN